MGLVGQGVHLPPEVRGGHANVRYELAVLHIAGGKGAIEVINDSQRDSAGRHGRFLERVCVNSVGFRQLEISPPP